MNLTNETILIIDYGSQYTQLIARKIREQSVYCLVYPYNKIDSYILKNKNLLGIILSGGPNSVKDKKSPKLYKNILTLKIPILGVCYGLQLLCKEFYGKIGFRQYELQMPIPKQYWISKIGLSYSGYGEELISVNVTVKGTQPLDVSIIKSAKSK